MECGAESATKKEGPFWGKQAKGGPGTGSDPSHPIRGRERERVPGACGGGKEGGKRWVDGERGGWRMGGKRGAKGWRGQREGGIGRIWEGEWRGRRGRKEGGKGGEVGRGKGGEGRGGGNGHGKGWGVDGVGVSR